MKKLKDIVKNDFENKLDKKPSFDVSKLEDNREFKRSKWPLIVSLAAVLTPVILIAVPLVSSMFDIESSFSNNKKNYSLNELKLIESSSFKKLNEVDYPSSQRKNLKISQEYIEAMNNFTNKIYHQLDKQDNLSFSPMGLYSSLNILSYGAEEAQEELDSLLGLSVAEREQDFQKMFQNNYFSNENGVVQLANALFMTNKFEYNEEFINDLTRNYTEAYQLDFQKDSAEMLKWANQKLNEGNFFSNDDLEIDKDTAIYLLSTLYFDNKWLHRFDSSSSVEDNFYLSNKQAIKTTYMNAAYFGDVYDYGSFISCYNYYCNNMKIEYFVPKENGDIYELTKDINLFDKENATLLENQIIDLSVPRFNSSSKIDFAETLKKVGLTKSFDKTSLAFNKAFKNLPEDTSIYLKTIKQKNKVAFNEDGTTIKSLSFSMLDGAMAAAPMDNGYRINLNQPFIYIIYDNNSLPLFMGTVDNPKL